MKKTLLSFIGATIVVACNNSSAPEMPETALSQLDGFVAIAPSDITESPFRRIGDAFLITAGVDADYNTMTASWGSWGIFFNEPTTTCLLRANRYTLEYIRRTKTYTLAFFDEQYREQVMHFGLISGRNSDKMKTHQLTVLTTPAGNIAYREASLIIECELIQLTTVHPDDFFRADDKAFIVGGYEEAKDYHKLVTGKITGVWAKAPSAATR
ncbi:MAG: flavin reductase [Prevotellaceae bacterium]|jgi:flavin reductase (DIM6/NTAB) family NADH-FMN oxidoreductase RutF|nr:flavin reductase [Prevotellaceae bacterium]